MAKRQVKARLAAWLAAAAALAFGLGMATEASATEPCEGGLDLARVLESQGAAGMADVQSLDFTFNVTRDGVDMARSWHWDRLGGEVTLVTVNEDGSREMLAFESPPPAGASEAIRDADRAFVNDRYWLLFPAQLAWETGVTVTAECAPQPLPIGEGALPRFTVTYGSDGGYTPGDAYDFWVDADGQVVQWAYHRGGAEEPLFAVTAEAYAEVGPLRLAMEHRGPDGERRVWFTDVAATTLDAGMPETAPTHFEPR